MTNLKITIRKAASAEDAERLLYLITRLADFENLTPPDDAARARFVHDGFERTPPRFEAMLVSVDGEAPCGYAIYFETYSTFLCRPTLYLEDIFVLPCNRNSGVGRALMRAYVQEASSRGCGRAEWACLDWNISAQRFYKRVGAAHLSEWFFYRLDSAAMAAYLGEPQD